MGFWKFRESVAGGMQKRVMQFNAIEEVEFGWGHTNLRISETWPLWGMEERVKLL
jgi:hypothetical protein